MSRQRRDAHPAMTRTLLHGALVALLVAITPPPRAREMKRLLLPWRWRGSLPCARAHGLPTTLPVRTAGAAELNLHAGLRKQRPRVKSICAFSPEDSVKVFGFLITPTRRALIEHVPNLTLRDLAD